MSSPTTTAAGVIHDIGYRRYTGPRLGRGYRSRSIYTHALRTAYGLGRGVWSKVAAWGIFSLLMVVAAVIVAVQSQVLPPGERLVEYWQYPTQVNILVLLFCAVVGPDLVSRDLRSGVLPLYFSRPISRVQYPVAKWSALVSAVFLLLAGPLLLLFLGTAFSLNDMGAVWHEFVAFTEGLVAAAVTALLYSSIALLISALAGRRAVAGALIAGLFIMTTPLLGALQVIAYAQSSGGELAGSALALQQLSFLVSPFTVVEGLAGWLFGDGAPIVGPYGPLYAAVTTAFVAICVLLTLLRYRKVAR